MALDANLQAAASLPTLRHSRVPAAAAAESG
jgi:hypothetical protein